MGRPSTCTCLIVVGGLCGLIDGVRGIGQALLAASLLVVGRFCAVHRLGLGLECSCILGKGGVKETFLWPTLGPNA